MLENKALPTGAGKGLMHDFSNPKQIAHLNVPMIRVLLLCVQK